PLRAAARAARRTAWSCGLPELESVSFQVGRPAEPAELHLLHPFVDGDACGAELVEHRVQVAHAKVDHRLLPTRAEVLGFVCKRRSDRLVAFCRGERRAV